MRGITLSLDPGEVLGIVGESGSGKSVTALATMGLLPKNARVTGSITYDGRELLGLKEKQLAGVRGVSIAMIFQDPMTSLNPVYTVGWQIAEAVRAHQDVSKDEAMAKAVDLLKLVGIPNATERARNYPHEFSGGMRQRVVIAVAMANNPAVILADEPTTALDVTVQAQVLEHAAEGAGGDRRGAAAHHPRPRGHRRAGRPRPRHVRRAPGGDRHGRPALLPAGHALHPRPARVPPEARRRGRRAPAADPRVAPVADRRRRGLPVRAPLPAPARDLRRRGARAAAGRRTDGPRAHRHVPADGIDDVDDVGHVAACHFADEVAVMPTASMFPDSSADHEGVAP